MCYDVAFKADIAELEAYFPGVKFDMDIEMNSDAAIHILGHDYGAHPVIYKNREDGLLHCRLMEWGVIPYYIKDEARYQRQRATMLNARSEKILTDDKSYWYQIRNRRCLVPVTGFYEHRGIAGWKKKVPYFLQVKDQPIFFFPGLYSVAELPDMETGELVKRWTFTLITRDANDVMKNIHNDGENRHRMPLIVPFEVAAEWVTNELSPARYSEILNYELPSAELEYRPVFTIRSSKPRPDGKMKDAYWEWDKLPELGVGNPL